MGFIRQQEERWAMKLLAWQHEKHHIPLPSRALLQQQAKALVDDAHRIAAERGRNVLTIIKETVADFIKNRK
jgi:hypothetical protein